MCRNGDLSMRQNSSTPNIWLVWYAFWMVLRMVLIEKNDFLPLVGPVPQSSSLWFDHGWPIFGVFFSSKNLQNNLVFVGFFSSKKTIFHHISMGWPWFHQQKHPKNPWFLQLEVGGPRSCQVHVDGLGIKPEKRWGYPRYLRCWILFNQHLLKQLAHIYRWYIGKYGIHGTVLYSVSSVSWKLQLF